MLVLIAILLVGLLVHELVDVGLVLNLDLDDPAVLLGFVVDEGGVGLHVLVVGSDHAGDWGVHISCSLDRLDTADAVSLHESCADLSQVEVHDVTELALSEVGDANLGLLK